jgi:hypothetical protein
MNVIEKANQTWSTSKIDIYPAVKFQVEDHPESYKFLIPLMWSTIISERPHFDKGGSR